MANALYDKGRQKFLEGGIAWLTDDIRCALIDLDDYTPDLANDEFLDDVPGAAIVATSADLTGKSSTDGVADADDALFSTVSGDESEAVLVYKWTGSAATSPLIALLDTVTGLPATPTGGNVNMIWSNGPDKLFKL